MTSVPYDQDAVAQAAQPRQQAFAGKEGGQSRCLLLESDARHQHVADICRQQGCTEHDGRLFNNLAFGKQQQGLKAGMLSLLGSMLLAVA
jgi:hypothetical protein